jgi:hypothetical protein
VDIYNPAACARQHERCSGMVLGKLCKFQDWAAIIIITCAAAQRIIRTII